MLAPLLQDHMWAQVKLSDQWLGVEPALAGLLTHSESQSGKSYNRDKCRPLLTGGRRMTIEGSSCELLNFAFCL